jgi:hypothetical protein
VNEFALLVPSHATVDEAMDWLHQRGEVVRVCLMRGADGMVRGNAVVRLRCTVHDAPCLNPRYCFSRWACCAGDPDMPADQ